MNNSSDSRIGKISNVFHVADYIVFGVFLLLSMSVGVFYSLVGDRQRTVNEYVMGNRRMSTIPTAISLGMSFVSALTIIGQPAEFYIYGYQYSLVIIPASIAFIILSFVIVSIMYPLKLTSPNEYLLERFQWKSVGLLGNFLSSLYIVVYMGSAIYAPALAINLVTGGRITTAMGIVISGTIGAFYTLIGGLKAVVWSDVLQSVFIFIALIAVLIRGWIDVGSFEEAVRQSINYGRFHAPEVSIDPRIRHTIWGLLVSGFVDYSSIIVTPSAVQRMWSFSNRREAIKGFIIALVVMNAIFLMSVGIGFFIFGYYAKQECDIYKAGFIENKNDIVSYYVMDRMNFPGFPGLFVVSIYSGAMSTYSSGLNSLATTTWKDVLQPYIFKNLSQIKSTLILKSLVCLYGIISIAFGFMFMTMGGMLVQAIIAVMASIRGPYLAIFILGLCFPCVHQIGVILGSLVAFGIFVFINIMAQTAENPIIPPVKLPFTIDNCLLNSTVPIASDNINLNTNTSATHQTPILFKDIYNMSYTYYSATGFLITLFLALIATVSLRVCCKIRPRRFDKRFCVKGCFEISKSCMKPHRTPSIDSEEKFRMLSIDINKL